MPFIYHALIRLRDIVVLSVPLQQNVLNDGHSSWNYPWALHCQTLQGILKTAAGAGMPSYVLHHKSH